MRKISILFAIVILTVCVASCLKHEAQAEKNDKENADFTEFLSEFSDSTAYAVVTLDGQQVLLVSGEVFNNTGDSTNVQLAALSAQLYRHNDEGKIVPLGEVRSQSTGDPVALAKDGIMTAGHRYVYKYILDGTPGELRLAESLDLEYGENDAVTTHYEDRQTDTYRDKNNDEDMNMMFDRYSKAKPIIFKYVK